MNQGQTTETDNEGNLEKHQKLKEKTVDQLKIIQRQCGEKKNKTSHWPTKKIGCSKAILVRNVKTINQK